MKNNNYALFYKKTKYDSWHSERPDMPVQLWEYTKTKLHAWLKDDFARLVYEDLSSDESEIVFDIAVDKNWFFETAEKMIIQMEKTAEKEEQKYRDYIGKVKRNA